MEDNVSCIPVNNCIYTVYPDESAFSPSPFHLRICCTEGLDKCHSLYVEVPLRKAKAMTHDRQGLLLGAVISTCHIDFVFLPSMGRRLIPHPLGSSVCIPRGNTAPQILGI